jgi:hypothetical protein
MFMVGKISDIMQKHTKGWRMLVLFLLDAAFMGLILPMAEGLMKMDSGGPGPIDLQIFYTPAKAYEMISSYGEYGRSFYRNIELTVDLIYPIIYTLFFSMLITWLFQRGFSPSSRMQRMNVVPFGAWLFDLLENIGIVSMLSIFPSTPVALAALTSVFTLIKWLFAFASMLLVLVGLVMALKNGFRRQVPAAA